jgi:hypothetical protein
MIHRAAFKKLSQFQKTYGKGAGGVPFAFHLRAEGKASAQAALQKH